MPKYLQDVCSGIVFICISLAFGLQYKQLGGVSRIFPEALISLISFGGIYYLLKGYVRYRKQKKDETEDTEKEPFLFMRLLYILLSAFILIFLIEYIGFYCASFLFLFVSCVYLANKRADMAKTIRNGIIFSFCFMVSVWFLFHYILLVPTPAGLLF